MPIPTPQTYGTLTGGGIAAVGGGVVPAPASGAGPPGLVPAVADVLPLPFAAPPSLVVAGIPVELLVGGVPPPVTEGPPPLGGAFVPPLAFRSPPGLVEA